MTKDIFHSQAPGITVLTIALLVTTPVWATLLITAIRQANTRALLATAAIIAAVTAGPYLTEQAAEHYANQPTTTQYPTR